MLKKLLIAFIIVIVFFVIGVPTLLFLFGGNKVCFGDSSNPKNCIVSAP